MRKVPSWDEYFLMIAKTVSLRSKDPTRQVGAILVDQSTKQIVGTGYNGMPAGTLETPELWGKPTKYQHVIHAEINAIKHTVNIGDFDSLSLYTTTFPCVHCMQEIICYPIKRIVFSELYRDSQQSLAIATQSGLGLITLKAPIND
jgi:dCMP deaminase